METFGPACAIGSRATLPANPLARAVILENDCADYLECVGWHTGEARRAYLAETAADYCAAYGAWVVRYHESAVRDVESYMRRHVAAYVRRLREIGAARRAGLR